MAIAPPRPAASRDPLAQAASLLADARTRAALLREIETRVTADPVERRHFAAAAGRVHGATGDAALTRAVTNYLQDLARPSDGARTAALLWLAETVARIGGGGPTGHAETADPRAAAEALFRPRTAPLTASKTAEAVAAP